MSRYPAFGRAAGGYDESLLQIAPQITKADRQQGYSVDILEQSANYQYGPNAPRRQPVAQGYEQHRYQQRQAPQQPSYPYDQSIPPSMDKADYYSSSSSTEDQRDIFAINVYKPKKPWFRTKRGLLILFVVLLVVAGGTVGIVFGVRAAMNKAKADKTATQRGTQSGSGGSNEVGPSGRGGGAANTTNDGNSLPSLPSLSLVTLGSARQSAAITASQANLVLTLRLNPAPASQTRPALTPPQATGINLAGVGPTSAQVASTTLANVGPTPTVDPVCARFPTLPSCQQG